MQWVKHDTNANQDAKLQSVLLDYGLEGYGLYWYCIELIAGKVSQENITFELEHDARIIARNTGSTSAKVTEMMRNFVDIGLFEDSNGTVTCLKLAKRLDQSMTSNPKMRALISSLKSGSNPNENHDGIMMKSDLVMQDKNRIDKNRIDKKTCEPKVPFKMITELYMELLPSLPKVALLTEKRKTAIRQMWNYNKKHQSKEFFEDYFPRVKTSAFLNGSTGWRADLAWLMKIDNMAKVYEGYYENRS